MEYHFIGFGPNKARFIFKTFGPRSESQKTLIKSLVNQSNDKHQLILQYYGPSEANSPHAENLITIVVLGTFQKHEELRKLTEVFLKSI